jgi:hypothetical protein
MTKESLQGPNIDPQLLATLQTSFNAVKRVRDAFNKVKNGRNVQGTWEKSSQLMVGV